MMTLSNDADSFARAVNVLLNRYLVRGADGHVRPWPYNPVDYGVLRFLGTHPDARATDVGAHVGTPATTMQSALDRLTAAGLLDKRRHPDDGRARAYRLSQKGRDILTRIEAQDRANMAEMMEEFTAAERRELVRLLERIVAS